MKKILIAMLLMIGFFVYGQETDTSVLEERIYKENLSVVEIDSIKDAPMFATFFVNHVSNQTKRAKKVFIVLKPKGKDTKHFNPNTTKLSEKLIFVMPGVDIHKDKEFYYTTFTMKFVDKKKEEKKEEKVTKK